MENQQGILKVSSLNKEFMVCPEALTERHKDFWERFQGNWEEENKKTFSDFIDNETIVIDLGAWVGPITFFCAALGAKHVYAFEPDTRAFEFLNKNFLINQNFKDQITLSNSAIGKFDGEIKIGPLSGRELGDSTTSTEGASLSSVPSISVDSLFKNCRINSSKKFCIKMDIEGSEKYILEDIANLLLKTKQPFLFLAEINAYHFNLEERKKIKKILEGLISASDKFVFKQLRRMGEPKVYPDVDTEWKSEIFHKYGYFDMTFERK